MSTARDEALKAVLADRLQALARSSAAPELSYRRVLSAEPIGVPSRSDEGMIEFEALTARFARVFGTHVQRALRTIDEIEGQEPARRSIASSALRSAAGSLPLPTLRQLADCPTESHTNTMPRDGDRSRAVDALVPSLLLSVERDGGGAATARRGSAVAWTWSSHCARVGAASKSDEKR